MKNLVLMLFIFITSETYAAGVHMIAGGRSAAMGCNSVALSDEWSAVNNPAGLAWHDLITAGIYFDNRYLTYGLWNKSVAVGVPAGKGCLGISLGEYGFNLYSEKEAGLSYGIRLAKRFSAGVRLGYLRLHIEDGFSDTQSLSSAAGLQYRATDHLWLGVDIENPIPFKISVITQERLPVSMKIGVGWIITSGLVTGVELEKSTGVPAVIKAALEYFVSGRLVTRFGLLTNPSRFTFGFGIIAGRLRLDVASSYHLVLGYSPQASVSYYFGKKH